MQRKKIAFLATGGTIAGVSYGPRFPDLVGDGWHRAYETKLSGQQILDMFPDANEIADIEVKDLLNIDSTNMVSDHWDYIGERTFPYVIRGDIDGIVVSAGTNTMDYLSTAMALMLTNPRKPVVLVGASSPADQDKNHIRRHFEDSITTACSDIKEVLFCYSGDPKSTYSNVWRASTVIKMYPNFNNAFNSFVEPPLAEVRDKRVCINTGYKTNSIEGRTSLETGFDKSVALFEYFPFMDHVFDGLLTYFARDGYPRGVILGADVIPGENGALYRFAKTLLLNNTAVAVADSGFPKSNLDKELEREGVIYLGRTYHTKAFTKLMWVLNRSSNQETTKQMMLTNYAGELNGSEMPS